MDLAAAHINDDGHSDLAGPRAMAFTSSYNGQERTFAETIIRTSNVLTHTPMLVDFDGNGMKDIGFAAGNYPTDQTVGICILYQTTPGVFVLGPYRSFDTFKGQSGVLAFLEAS
jgi:hypothetical protein